MSRNIIRRGRWQRRQSSRGRHSGSRESRSQHESFHKITIHWPHRTLQANHRLSGLARVNSRAQLLGMESIVAVAERLRAI